MKVAVIGGGPGGLVALRFLANAHEFFPIPRLEVRLFEAEAEIGGTFVYHVYEDAEMVSSKYLTAFSDFRLPRDAPDFVTPETYVKYLKDYVTNFNLESYIECGSRVERVRRSSGKSGHVIEIKKPDGSGFEWECDAVAVCSGLNGRPIIPDFEGLDRVPVVLHSSELKTREQFGSDTNVVVFGAGETGMDIAHLAVTSPTKSVTICHRDGFFCAPKIIPVPEQRLKSFTGPNKPVDTSIASLFDTAYAHPVLQRSSLLWLAYDRWVKNMHWLISGTEEGPDQWVGHMSKDRKHLDSIILCKSNRALPYLSAGHRSGSWLNRTREKWLNVPIKDTHGRKIDVVKWPTGIDQDGLLCLEKSATDNPRIKPDVIVFATGYDGEMSYLDKDYPRLPQANVRGVYKEGDVTVGFIGYARPSIGAMPPLAEMQAQLWVLRLLQNEFPEAVPLERDGNSVPPYDMDYALHSRAGYDLFSTKRAVDHESYAYQLALDIGSAPTLTYMLGKGWKIFFTWAMGSNFNPKFRFVGPWKWEAGAETIMRTELFDVVKRTGGLLYLVTYSIIPFFFFGTLSVTLYASFGIVHLVEMLGQKVSGFISKKPVEKES